MLFSLKSEDPYLDLKKFMEKMEKLSPLMNRWRSKSEGRVEVEHGDVVVNVEMSGKDEALERFCRILRVHADCRQ